MCERVCGRVCVWLIVFVVVAVLLMDWRYCRCVWGTSETQAEGCCDHTHCSQQGCGSLARATCLWHVTDRRGFSLHIPVPGTCARQRTAGSTAYANLSLHKQGAGLEDKVTWSQLGLGKNIHFLISCDFHLKFLKISRSISHSMYIFGGCVNMLMRMSLLLDELYSLECIVWGPAVNL